MINHSKIIWYNNLFIDIYNRTRFSICIRIKDILYVKIIFSYSKVKIYMSMLRKFNSVKYDAWEFIFFQDN